MQNCRKREKERRKKNRTQKVNGKKPKKVYTYTDEGKQNVIKYKKKGMKRHECT